MSFLLEASRQGADDVLIASNHSIGPSYTDSSRINPLSHLFGTLRSLDDTDINSALASAEAVKDFSDVLDGEDDWLVIDASKEDTNERILHQSRASQPYICSKWYDLNRIDAYVPF